MRNFIIFSFLALLIFMASFFHFFEKEKKSVFINSRAHVEQENQRRIEYAVTGGVSKKSDQNEFEKKILDLLKVSSNDTYRPWGMEIKDNIRDRKKYFSEKAWLEYQKYISTHKKILSEKSDYHWAVARYFPKSKTYKNLSLGHKNFCVLGNFDNSTGDNYWPAENFKLNFDYNSKDLNSLSNLEILNWKIEIFPKQKEMSVDGCND